MTCSAQNNNAAKPVGRKSTNPASSLKVANRKELEQTRETIVNVKKKRELAVVRKGKRFTLGNKLDILG